MILIIDNYDSFVYTLAGYINRLGHATDVRRNDKITIEEIKTLTPRAIILSPGPCTPKEAGICISLIQALGETIPILGVCLGHQAIGEAYGGKTIRAKKPIHGKTSLIDHDGSTLFHGLPNPIEAGRYHSLITNIETAPTLKATALSESDEIMAIQHKKNPVFGVQFHPESILTPHGMDIMQNFMIFVSDWHTAHK